MESPRSHFGNISMTSGRFPPQTVAYGHKKSGCFSTPAPDNPVRKVFKATGVTPVLPDDVTLQE